MKPVVTFVLVLVLSAVQAAVLRFVFGGALPVSIVLPCVVYLGIQAGNVDGALGAAGAGYVLDLMAGGPKGLMTFLAVALFLVARLVGAAVEVRGKIGFALLTGFGCLFFGLGAFFFTRSVSPALAAPPARRLPRIFLLALLTSAISPLVFLLMRRVDALFTREEPGLLR